MLFKTECYEIIGVCMEVHKNLGRGHKEVIYQDALEIEFQLNQIPYIREKSLPIKYKGHILPHHSVADFLVFDKIIVETKAISELTKSDIGQILNQISSGGFKLGLLVNFGEESLNWKRIVR